MQACFRGITGTERKKTPASDVADRIVYFHPVADACWCGGRGMKMTDFRS